MTGREPGAAHPRVAAASPPLSACLVGCLPACALAAAGDAAASGATLLLCAGITLLGLGALALGAVLFAGLRQLRRHCAGLEEQLQAREALAQAAESAGLPLVVADAQGRITWANDAFTALSGYTLEQARGHTPRELLQTPRTDPDTVASIRAALRAGRGARARLLNRSLSGRDYWVETDIQPLRDAHGTVTGYVAVEAEVTELVQLHASLAEQREQLEAVIAAADLATWDWSLHTGEVRTNARWLTMLGYPPGTFEVSLETWTRLLHPEDLPGVEAMLARHFEDDRQPFHAQVRMHQADGSWRWILTSGRVIARGGDGQPVRMAGVHLDIDEGVRAGERAREQALLLAGIAANVPGVLYQQRMEPDGGDRIPFASAGLERIYGVSPEQVARDAGVLAARIHPDDAATVAQSLRACKAQMRMWHCEYRVMQPDGQPLWVEARARPRDGGGGAVIWEGYLADVSDRKRAELGAALSRAQLAAFVRHVPAAAAMLDTGLRVVAHTGRWAAMYALQAGAVDGEAFATLLPGEAARWAPVLARCLAGAVEHADAEAWRRPDGSDGWLRWEVRPWSGPDGVVAGLILLTEDISEARRARDELARHRDELAALVDERTAHLAQALHEARQANAAKSEFLANMSHELRTPMHAILSFTELGEQRAAAAESGKLGQYFSRIRQSSLRLLALLNDLLDLSRIEAGHLRVEPRDTDLVVLAAQCRDTMAPLAAARLVRVVDGGSPATLLARADPLRIGQVVTNLLSNAIKFSEAGGEVRLSLRREPGTAADGGDCAVLEVADRGVGVPEDELERIFEKFVQSSRTRTGAGGTGLGLAICRQIMGAHGGTLHAEPNAGGGTRFIARLPLRQGAAQPAAA